jgi:alginate O-acetyltransferase complex protein AlgI
MLFNSIDFAIFLPVTFVLYWFVFNQSLKIQNLFLLAASYLFYSWWDWRLLSLIIASTLLDYSVGLILMNQNDPRKRKAGLYFSILGNLSILATFKYYDFFLNNFITVFSFFGSTINPNTLDLILPIGISFYTFQTMSYTIDVYHRKLNGTKNIIAFSTFISFFPQLVAGPIERARNLLPQFYKERTFDYSLAVSGLKQILWGLFKKIVIADNSAELANIVFNDPSKFNGSTLVLGIVFFAFQLYGDFSGYSDIAIGTARLFGFNLTQNFAYPYFSKNIPEFWSRWHISLSTWFRDYVYIPFSIGSKKSKWIKIRNTFLLFLLIGLWHGPNWTFIFWGLLNGIYFLPKLLETNKKKPFAQNIENKVWIKLMEYYSIIQTFALAAFAGIFFRADNLSQAFDYIFRMFSFSIFEYPQLSEIKFSKVTMIIVVIFMYIEWLGQKRPFAIANVGEKWRPLFRYIFYYLIVLSILFLGGKQQEFIYFQF